MNEAVVDSPTQLEPLIEDQEVLAVGEKKATENFYRHLNFPFADVEDLMPLTAINGLSERIPSIPAFVSLSRSGLQQLILDCCPFYVRLQDYALEESISLRHFQLARAIGEGLSLTAADLENPQLQAFVRAWVPLGNFKPEQVDLYALGAYRLVQFFKDTGFAPQEKIPYILAFAAGFNANPVLKHEEGTMYCLRDWLAESFPPTDKEGKIVGQPRGLGYRLSTNGQPGQHSLYLETGDPEWLELVGMANDLTGSVKRALKGFSRNKALSAFVGEEVRETVYQPPAAPEYVPDINFTPLK